MKLASLKGGPDGRLVVVSNDLAWCVDASPVATSLRAALDDWETCEPQLRALARDLEIGAAPQLRFHEHEAAAALPRAVQHISAAAYGPGPAPMLRQRASDGFSGARDAVALQTPAWDCRLEAGLAVIIGDVAAGAPRTAAAAAVRLVTLAGDVALRALLGDDHLPGFGTLHGRPDTALGPVAVTPDALGDAWSDGRLRAVMEMSRNGGPVRELATDAGLGFDFPTLIAHAARTRPLGMGSVIASGPLPAGDAAALAHGDEVRIEVRDARGHSIFGAIERRILPPTGDATR